MDWFGLSLIAAVMTAVISTIDKVVIDRFFYNAYAYPFFTALMMGLYSFIILAYRMISGEFYVPNPFLLLLAVSSALTHIVGAVFLTKALMMEDASTVFSLTQINPIFALGWGMIFFGDFFLPENYLGVLLMVGCAVIISSRQNENGRIAYRWNKAVGLVLIAVITRSIGDLSLKLALNHMNLADVFAINRTALLFSALFMLTQPGIRRQILQPVQKYGVKIILLVGIIELFAMTNLLIYIQAFANGPMALVSALQAMVPVFILILTHLTNTFSPDFIKVRVSGWSGMQKAVLSGGIVVGAFLLNLRRS